MVCRGGFMVGRIRSTPDALRPTRPAPAQGKGDKPRAVLCEISRSVVASRYLSPSCGRPPSNTTGRAQALKVSGHQIPPVAHGRNLMAGGVRSCHGAVGV